MFFFPLPWFNTSVDVEMMLQHFEKINDLGGFPIEPGCVAVGSLSLFEGGESYRVLKGGVFKGRGCSWGTQRIPEGKIGEAKGRLGESPPPWTESY